LNSRKDLSIEYFVKKCEKLLQNWYVKVFPVAPTLVADGYFDSSSGTADGVDTVTAASKRKTAETGKEVEKSVPSPLTPGDRVKRAPRKRQKTSRYVDEYGTMGSAKKKKGAEEAPSSDEDEDEAEVVHQKSASSVRRRLPTAPSSDEDDGDKKMPARKVNRDVAERRVDNDGDFGAAGGDDSDEDDDDDSNKGGRKVAAAGRTSPAKERNRSNGRYAAGGRTSTSTESHREDSNGRGVAVGSKNVRRGATSNRDEERRVAVGSNVLPGTEDQISVQTPGSNIRSRPTLRSPPARMVIGAPEIIRSPAFAKKKRKAKVMWTEKEKEYVRVSTI